MAVEAINRKKSLVLMSGGSTVPITNWLDASGDDCAEPDAVLCVCGPSSEGRWHTLELSDFDMVSTH
jgi:hypothetical protein